MKIVIGIIAVAVAMFIASLSAVMNAGDEEDV